MSGTLRVNLPHIKVSVPILPVLSDNIAIFKTDIIPYSQWEDSMERTVLLLEPPGMI
jgi:hypothetical protein